MPEHTPASDRLDVRLDSERRRKLEDLAAAEGASVSEAVRRMIDRQYELSLQERRHEAARRLAALQVEDVPDPETLSRQLEGAYGPGDLR